MSSVVKKVIPWNYFALLGILFAYILFFPLLLLNIQSDEFLVVLVASFPSLMLISYTFSKSKKDFDLIHPLHFIFLSVLLGTSVRSYHMFTTADPRRLSYYFQEGVSPFFFVGPALVITIAFGILIMGFHTKTKRLNLASISRLFRHSKWNKKRLWFIIIVFALAGGWGMFLFFKKIGLTALVLENFSEKRRVNVDSQGFQKISFGYYRWLGSFIKIGFYLAFAFIAKTKKSFFSPLGIMTLILFIGSILFPIMLSSRSHVVYVFINSIIIWYYLRGFPLVTTVFSVVLLLTISNLMLFLRHTNIDSSSELVTQASSESGLDGVVGSGNMMGIAKTAHILNRVPSKTGHVLGQSFVSWIFVPIPRSFWHDKPPVFPGNVIKRDIFLKEKDDFIGAGYPPAIVGELFWNFSWPGIIIGMFLIGRFLKFFYASFRPYLKHNTNALLIYVALLINLTFILIGSSFSQGIVNGIIVVIPIILGLYLISDKNGE